MVAHGRVMNNKWRMVTAAFTACNGLELDPHKYLIELDPIDYHDILTDPELARAFAVSLAGRLS